MSVSQFLQIPTNMLENDLCIEQKTKRDTSLGLHYNYVRVQ